MTRIIGAIMLLLPALIVCGIYAKQFGFYNVCKIALIVIISTIWIIVATRFIALGAW